MNVLVIGGAGYVGSHVAHRLVQSGHVVFVYDSLATGHLEAVIRAVCQGRPTAGGNFVKGDILDQSKLRKVLKEKKIDAVMHFAARALVGESVSDPSLYFQNNVEGSRRVLDSMLDAGVHKIVFSSSAAVYGECDQPMGERSPTDPVNPYGFTKLAVEKMLAAYAFARGIKYAALRYFNAAGAAVSGPAMLAGGIGEDHFPETHLIPTVLQTALGERSHVVIYGDDYDTPDGTCIRDYVHVEDLADAHIAALADLEQYGEVVLNLGSEDVWSVKEVVEVCRKVTGREIRVEVGPRRKGDPARLIADSQNARLALGWRPKYGDLESIISTAWEWHSRGKKYSI